MEELRLDQLGELLPIELWKGKHYQEIWNRLRPLADSEELAWNVFAEIICQMVLRRNVTGYPLGRSTEPDDAPDADENLPWPFTEEDELRHRRLLLLQAKRRAEERLAVLEGQMELY